jgi:hypothetical protein
MGALKKPCDKTPSTPVKKPVDATETAVQKAEIERMKRLVTEKIKDPKLAKKAALIISEMLNSKT